MPRSSAYQRFARTGRKYSKRNYEYFENGICVEYFQVLRGLLRSWRSVLWNSSRKKKVSSNAGVKWKQTLASYATKLPWQLWSPDMRQLWVDQCGHRPPVFRVYELCLWKLGTSTGTGGWLIHRLLRTHDNTNTEVWHTSTPRGGIKPSTPVSSCGTQLTSLAASPLWSTQKNR
jgi:hypothetical protein